jgi:hypothetical protein
LYEALWTELADEPLVDSVVDEYGWNTPLKVVAALHSLVLAGKASWDDPGAALRSHADEIRRFVREQEIQTNEVQRSWMLLPCFLEAARRARADTLDLVELGPSAGLNLVWDRYRYRYENGVWGDPSAPLELTGEERAAVPAELLRLRPRVRGRIGIDRSPVDVTTAEGAQLLKSFVWPDQTWRLDGLDRAIGSLRGDPPALLQGDVVETLPRVLAERRGDALTLVYATAVLGYLSEAQRRRVVDALEEAAGTGPGPIAFVTTGQPARDVHTFYALRLRVWPDDPEPVVLAHADFHGAWIEWLDAS